MRRRPITPRQQAEVRRQRNIRLAWEAKNEAAFAEARAWRVRNPEPEPLPLLSSTTTYTHATPTRANPECEVCGGTGTDPVFYGDCTECWPDEPRTSVAKYLAQHRQEQYEARRQQAQLNRTP